MVSKLKTVKYTNHATLNRPARTLKWSNPVCARCASEKPYEVWWDDCPHMPYYSTVEDVRVEFKTETNEDGEEVILEETSHPIKKRRLNTIQVPAEDKIYSGKGPQWSLERGFKKPEDLGYAPMCEYYNCWTPFPKYKTPWGNYCTKDQAAIINLRLQGFPIHTDPAVRRRQLDGVQVPGSMK